MVDAYHVLLTKWFLANKSIQMTIGLIQESGKSVFYQFLLKTVRVDINI